MPGNAFISYRREDTAGYAGRLYDRLKSAFPGRVFIDVGEIPPGADFVQVIEQHIEGCAALIALIGNNWTAQDRLHDPADFVRLEISSALKRNISIIPVLVGGAKLPAAATLPEDIQPLLRRQTISISDEDWEHGCERLIQALQKVIGPARKRSKLALRWSLAVAGASVVVALALVLFLKTRSVQPPVNTSQATPANMPETTRAASDYDKSVAKGYDNAAQVMGDIANKIGGSGNAHVPTITAVSPDIVSPGGYLTISGANFGTRGSVGVTRPDGITVVYSSDSVIKSWTANSITIQIPDFYKSGPAKVAVLANGVYSSAVHFTVKAS